MKKPLTSNHTHHSQRIQQHAAELANYRILGLAGQGQFAQVYCAVSRKTGQLVAIKQTRHAHEQASQEPFILHELHHSNVLACQAVAQQDNGYCLVLEYCEAGTLRTYLDTTLEASIGLPNRSSLVETKAFFSQILRGLSHIHSHGIIHGDLKPENIFLTYAASKRDHPWLTTKIGDFGSARFVELPSRSRREIGSPTYAAPERFQGSSTFASDLYAVGVMLYEMLLGTRPFAGSPEALRHAHQTQPVPLPQTLSQPARSLLATALHKRPEHRFATAEDMLRALNNLACVFSVPATPKPNAALKQLPHSTLTSALKSLSLAIEGTIQSLVTVPQGCCINTPTALHLLKPNKQLQTIVRFERPSWVAVSPNGKWCAAMSKSIHAHSPHQSKVTLYSLEGSPNSPPKALLLSGQLLTGLHSGILNLLSIDANHLLRIRVAHSTPTTYLECFTRRGQFVGQLTLSCQLTQILPTAQPYQFIGLSKTRNTSGDTPADTPAQQALLITLKPFQVRPLKLPFSPQHIGVLPWGYLITQGQTTLLLDRAGQPVTLLSGLFPSAGKAAPSAHSFAIATLTPQTLLIATSPPAASDPAQTADSYSRKTCSTRSHFFTADFTSLDLGFIF